jgi:hypothetical protein
MDKKSKILLGVLGVFITLSVSATFYKTVILQDFIVYNQIDCDPSSESCFVWVCDPALDGEDACTGNPEEDTWYFKIAYRNAMNVPECAPEDGDCSPFQCPTEGEDGCEEVLCSPEALIEYDLGDECTSPTDFIDVGDETNLEEQVESEDAATTEDGAIDDGAATVAEEKELQTNEE